MHLHRELLSLLSDGRFHSGEVLGQTLGISRAKVWLSLKELQQYGIEIQSVKGRGYRLSQPLELLVPDKLSSYLTNVTRAQLCDFEIAFSIDSTNSYLMQRALQGTSSGTVCFAEHQRAGKGRRGRSWVSPLGRNLYFSLLWRYDDGPMKLAGLSLAVAVAIVEGLQQTGISGIAIKWPNDIFTDTGKLGGILLEVAGESSGPCFAIVGVGLNIDMPNAAMNEVVQPWANLPYTGTRPSRNEIAARLLNHLFEVMSNYPSVGLTPYMERWREYDLTYNRQVDIHLHERIITGIARGIDATGALQVEHDGHVKSYNSGEISLRMVGP